MTGRAGRRMQRLAATAVALACGACAMGCGVAPANKGDETAVKLPAPAPDARPAPVASSETFLIPYQAKFDGLLAAGGSFMKGVPRSTYKNCRDYVTHNDDRYFSVEGDVGGHHFELSVEGVTIHGAGEYGPGPSALADIDFDGSDERYNFQQTATGGSTRISIDGDGSGQVVFSSWQNSSNEQESGAISWTCHP